MAYFGKEPTCQYIFDVKKMQSCKICQNFDIWRAAKFRNLNYFEQSLVKLGVFDLSVHGLQG